MIVCTQEEVGHRVEDFEQFFSPNAWIESESARDRLLKAEIKTPTILPITTDAIDQVPPIEHTTDPLPPRVLPSLNKPDPS